jgi:hypothetical protein
MARLRELTLDEMLADPIVHLMMRRDGVEEAHIRSLMARLGARPGFGVDRRDLSDSLPAAA